MFFIELVGSSFQTHNIGCWAWAWGVGIGRGALVLGVGVGVGLVLGVGVGVGVRVGVGGVCYFFVVVFDVVTVRKVNLLFVGQ